MLKPQQIKYVTKRLEDEHAKTIKILKAELKVERKVLGVIIPFATFNELVLGVFKKTDVSKYFNPDGAKEKNISSIWDVYPELYSFLYNIYCKACMERNKVIDKIIERINRIYNKSLDTLYLGDEKEALEVIANFSKCCEDLLQLNEEHISIID